MRYISILRGINVSGQKIINMNDLKVLYQDLKFTGVKTYIQSGNIIFDSTIKERSNLKEKIEKSIETKYAFHVPVIIRSPSEFSNIISNCPFSPVDLDKNGTKVLVTFLSSIPSKSNIDALLKCVKPPEQMTIKEKDIYLYCPNGYGKSKLSNNFLEKKSGVQATTRNWKSVVKLYELSAT